MRVRETASKRTRYLGLLPAAARSVNDPQRRERAWVDAPPRPSQAIAALDALRGQAPTRDTPTGSPAGEAGMTRHHSTTASDRGAR